MPIEHAPLTTVDAIRSIRRWAYAVFQNSTRATYAPTRTRPAGERIYIISSIRLKLHSVVSGISEPPARTYYVALALITVMYYVVGG